MIESTDGAETLSADIAVVGGGLAGLATAINLADRGRSVLCLEPRTWPRPAVGESLEFSAPRLLATLGIDVEAGEPKGYLFPKTSVQINSTDESFDVWPPAWFAKPPIWCSRLAFHTDRIELDQQILGLAVELGVRILPQRVISVEHRNDEITGLTTDRGARIKAKWYVDATGHETRLFGRTMNLDRTELGPPGIAYWARFDEPPLGHSTNLYMPRPDADQLAWIWEIPLNPSQTSVGVVLPSVDAATCRTRGELPRDIFRHHIEAIPSLRRLALGAADVPISSTAFTPYRHCRCVGPNWLLVGDAAAMVDPLTSNGVTAALRHADQGARLIAGSLERRPFRRYRAWAFDATCPATVATLDEAIDAFLYRPGIRQPLGLRPAVMLYAATGVVTNSVYARINPITLPRAVAVATFLAACRVWIRAASAALPHLATFRRRREGRRRVSG